MEIGLLIIRYSEFLANLSFTLSRVVDDLYVDRSSKVFVPEDFEFGILFSNYLLDEIARAKECIVYLQNLHNKKGV